MLEQGELIITSINDHQLPVFQHHRLKNGTVGRLMNYQLGHRTTASIETGSDGPGSVQPGLISTALDFSTILITKKRPHVCMVRNSSKLVLIVTQS
jgi:hypothetical protein